MRGRQATSSPATISITPTASIAWCAEPGITSLNCDARYFGQSVITLANLSSPNRIGATVNAVRRIKNASRPGRSVPVVAEVWGTVEEAMGAIPSNGDDFHH